MDSIAPLPAPPSFLATSGLLPPSLRRSVQEETIGFAADIARKAGEGEIWAQLGAERSRKRRIPVEKSG
jgi:hypothetical protein